MAEVPSIPKSLALLIDADNASPAMVSGLLAEVATYGTASVKRIYGDWTTTQLGSWKDELLKHSIQPVQQFSYTKGKNATDIAMTIDAMDLLYTGRFHAFCLVTSDSDFTPVAARIRQQGLTVYGFGERKTPEPFVAACDKFIYIDLLTAAAEGKPAAEAARPKNTTDLRKDGRLVNLIDQSIDAATSEEGGWASLGQVGALVSKRAPEFDSRNYGYAKLSGLVEAVGLYEISRQDKHLLIRRKRKRATAAKE